MIYHSFTQPFSNVRLFTTTRQGGVSKNTYSTFNLSPHTGDDPGNYSENLHRLSALLYINQCDIITPKQTHGSEIRIIDSDFLKLPSIEQKDALYGIDALISSLPHVCIGVTTADCVPVFLYDHSEKISAIVHAGWRGTCSKIILKTVHQMCMNFNCLPSNIYAVIGPSISANAYQVGEELIQSFENSEFNIDQIFKNTQHGLFLDLWEANKLVLNESGIDTARINIVHRCTYSEDQIFFSARRLGLNSGRMLSGIIMD